ncbi:Uncharacterised protein [Yersinia thracica]|jgi:hypothetical protein|uniref:Uncharacterized protein n=1 Tax=Yersinia thracica TaxID=2890319 RepID=A0A0T9PSC8_9GAMM|nr:MULTISPECIES: hypothetical protein [Yersinia]ATM88535.1 hypothetical protein CRN74_22250 [Yersinia frederiksenii]EKN4770862.1 hypothetical protein [Yersinia enterocolitica]MDA5531060.1 hypothetical protein [Yersinia enterocolitica]CNH79314.1 Uncharacterised protein [Yersinia thracica]HEI6960880.1 hypothetical protein [Yersinia enterocolitica]
MSETSINDEVIPAISVASTPGESSVFEQRSSVFKARLQRYKQLEKAQEIRDNLLKVAQKINAPTQKLEQTLSCYRVLRQIRDSENDEPIVGAFDRDTFGHPQDLLATFCLQYAMRKHDVAQEGEFARLILEIERLSRDLNEHTSKAWCEYTHGLKEQWEVDQKLFSSRVHLDEERKKQQRYVDLVAQFINCSRWLPKSAEEFEAVLTLHEQLCQVRETLKLNVPEDVNLFLKAVAGQGATLDMLTENVLCWLAKEDDPSRYRIKRL